jgi:alkanesulfonate monooxygenase SsuD/methylene tetrahydromethanopterin reductase-like flavin-dependent oxidoreductase (luciferase family)
MRVGIGLPTTTPGLSRALFLEWVEKAEAGPFATLGVFDRLAYDSLDPLISLTAAAAVTSRIRLATTILTSPLYNTAMLAKAAASLDVLSAGRLVLGLAIGARESDYDVAGIPTRTRGKRLTEQLATLRDYWEGDTVGPKPVCPGGPPLLVGGLNDQTFARVARYANGYLHGGGPPAAFTRFADRARAAWSDAGRPDRLQLWGMGYYALGEKEVEAGTQYLRHYYDFAGPFMERIAAGLLTTPQALVTFIRGYQEAGCDELILFPTVGHINQVERLAEIVA